MLSLWPREIEYALTHLQDLWDVTKNIFLRCPQEVALSYLRSKVCPSAGSVVVVNMASDGDSDEDFVNYGTPLEPLEEGTVFNNQSCINFDTCHFIAR